MTCQKDDYKIFHLINYLDIKSQFFSDRFNFFVNYVFIMYNKVYFIDILNTVSFALTNEKFISSSTYMSF